ncbi:Crp/Fnr family transcriptional regulator [Massilia sp. TS11]|uniref:Crp/Fnr family transcriptional regulator n=1 Tax=Massilia sp. TS11 TaxID=2908003 RepID=UPI001EDAA2AA|nr:cyclic nucleotide-binding domain-containing protein [Massilia sp. TS11]MCG2585620.1 cyclic nucleotide-binding domain-containing protein [Massilia sp. TS11]
MDAPSPLLRLAANVRLFAGMPMMLLGRMLGAADKVTLKAGELFFNEGDTGESFYILVIGHVAVEQVKGGKWVQLAQLNPGESFGEMSLVDDKIRTARVRALTDCTAMYFPIARLKADTEITSYLYRNIAKVLVARLKHTNSQVLDLTAKIAPEEPEEEAAAETPAADAADAEAAPEQAAADAEAAPLKTPSIDDIPELQLRPGGYRSF